LTDPFKGVRHVILAQAGIHQNSPFPDRYLPQIFQNIKNDSMPFSKFEVGRSMFDVHGAGFQPLRRGPHQTTRYAVVGDFFY
jgi:hypothetical protein